MQSPTIWAFDFGKASIGEAVRNLDDNAFAHVESLLIPAELARRGPAAASGSPANRYRALKTREAHRAREGWLETVWTASGLTPMRGRKVDEVDGVWRQVVDADPRLEREFATKGDTTCYTSCLLRIRLLSGDTSLEEWQIFKALRSALQRRGYGRVPWAAKEAVKQGKTADEVEKEEEKKLAQADPSYREAVGRWPDFKRSIARDPAYHFPCFFNAWKMGLWNPEDPAKHAAQINHLATSTRNVRFDRADVRKEIIKLGDEAAKILPAIRNAFCRWQREGWTFTHPVTKARLNRPVLAKSFGEFLCDGPAGTPDESSFDAFLKQRADAGLRAGTFEEWMAALGQKTPKFDNRILGNCVLIPRFHVCKVDVRFDAQTGLPVRESLLATEVTFLLKLKNLLVADAERGQRKLRPEEVRAIFAFANRRLEEAKLVGADGEPAKNRPDKVADCFTLTKSEWGRGKGLAQLGLKPLPGHEEVKAPRTSGRSAYSRVALRILKELVLSGEAPAILHARLLCREESLLRKLGSTDDRPLILADDSTANESETRRRENAENRKRGVLVSEIRFLLQMRKDDAKADSWDDLFVPSQTLDALVGRHTDDDKLDSEAAIRDLLGTVNDPIVRHRLGVFAERLKMLHLGDGKNDGFGVPDSVVLEFVREDFMGERARRDYQKFINDRERERKTARDEASDLGLKSRSSGLRYELWKAQGGICLYTGNPLSATKLDEYEIDHIVPRSLGGPDAAVNYVITTHDINHTKEKGKLTPYALFHGKEGWDAYVERVNKKRSALRNKKVQLLTREDARELVTRYTALAETAWISKLAQTIVNLRFGWLNGNDSQGWKRVTVVSGGLTARVRRKYDINRLLHGDDITMENAEKKNRDDHRHHALDAMVLTFVPQWARDPGKEGFFRFPREFRDVNGREDHGRIREHFRKALVKVMPRNLFYERPVLADTLYGVRKNASGPVIVQKVEVAALARKPIGPQKTKFDLEYARLQVKSIRDSTIRARLNDFLALNPQEPAWNEFSASFRQLRKDGSPGASIRRVFVNSGDPAEYKDLSKDGSGSYRKGKKGHRGQLVFLTANGQPRVRPVYAFESLAQARKSLLTEAEPGSRFYEFFQSGCLVTLDKPAAHPKHTLPPGKYLLNTIRAGGDVKLTTAEGKTYPDIPRYSLKVLVASGLRRAD
jgi:CRISPR-associated endonuclease Csn1